MITPARPMQYSKSHLYRGGVELERRITSKINELISTEIGKFRLRKMRELQLTFFLTAIKRIYYNEDRKNTYSNYLSLMNQLMEETTFFCDISNFKYVNFSRGLVLITGHFGIAKATKITRIELIEKLEEEIYDNSWLQIVNTPPNDEPFPLRVAAVFKTLFEMIGLNTLSPHEVHMWYNYPFDEIQKDCGVIGIYRDRPSQYSVMEKGLDRLFTAARAAEKVPVAIIYPESGTMGKRTRSGNPYELSDFHAGFAVYAMHANVPIVPIIQVVGNNAEFRTKVLKSFESPKQLTNKGLENFVAIIKQTMQQEINILNPPEG